jgi:hypothetical protein
MKNRISINSNITNNSKCMKIINKAFGCNKQILYKDNIDTRKNFPRGSTFAPKDLLSGVNFLFEITSEG